jgi:hypothetical protein
MFFLVGFATDDIYVVADFMDLPEKEDDNLQTSLFNLDSWRVQELIQIYTNANCCLPLSALGS